MSITKGIFLALGGAIAYGLQPICAKFLLNSGLNSTSALFYRFLIIAFIIGIYLLFKGKLKIPTKKQCTDFLFFGIVGYGGTAYLLTESFQYMPVGQATMIYFTYPIWVMLIMKGIFKENMSKNKLIALGLSLIGIAFLMNFDLTLNIKGMFLALGSGLAFGMYLISIDKSSYKNMGSMEIIFFMAVVNMIFWGIQGGVTSSLVPFQKIETMLFSITQAGVTIIALVLLTTAIKLIGPVKTSIVSIFEPLVALFLGFILFGESITIWICIGNLIMILAILIVSLEKKDDKVLS